MRLPAIPMSNLLGKIKKHYRKRGFRGVAAGA